MEHEESFYSNREHSIFKPTPETKNVFPHEEHKHGTN